MLRILVVDDQSAVRHGLKLRLGAEPDMTVVGEAGNGCAAIALAGQLAPDLILMDVEMPDRDGIEVARELSRLHPNIPVVFLTLRDNDATRAEAAAAHVAAFVSKEASAEYLLLTLRACGGCRGET